MFCTRVMVMGLKDDLNLRLKAKTEGEGQRGPGERYGEVGLREEDAMDRETWRLLSGKAADQPSGHRGGSAIK